MTDDCKSFTAWASPMSGEYCNANWPVLASAFEPLEAMNQTLMDCRLETGTAPAAGPCLLGTPHPICVDERCVIPKFR
jgi:hypothetical protein